MGMNFKDLGGKLDGLIGMVGLVTDMAAKPEPKAKTAEKTKKVEDLRMGEVILVDRDREFTVTQAPSLNGHGFVVLTLRGSTQIDAYLTMILGTEVRIAA